MFKRTEFFVFENPEVIDLTSLRKHISNFQKGYSKETTKGVQIVCQIDFILEGELNRLRCTYQLTQTIKILLIALHAFHVCVAATLYIEYLNILFPSTHFLFKAMFILPIFGLLTTMIMKVSFDQKVKELSRFIQVELKKQKI